MSHRGQAELRGARTRAVLRASRCGRAGYTLIEVLVSLTVVSVMIGILLPSLVAARSTALRLSCAMRERELGTGAVLFADDNAGLLPGSIFVPDPTLLSRIGAHAAHEAPRSSHDTVVLRLSESTIAAWRLGRMRADGLGLLHASGIIPTPESFYCPSHAGEFSFDRFREDWFNGRVTRIPGNYQYRAGNANRDRRVSALASNQGLIADALRSAEERNHEDGVNVLDGSLSVRWVGNTGGWYDAILPEQASAANDADTERAWHRVDALLARRPVADAAGE